MFIFTTKFNKKKAVIALLVLAAVLVAIILIAGRGGKKSTESGSFSAVVNSADERVKYLASLGWEVLAEPIDEQPVVIPKEFNDTYAAYSKLQEEQGFDLTKYCGLEVTRYTYQVLNYPNSTDSVVADILVYRDKIIGGDIQSTALDGFMSTLKYPSDAGDTAADSADADAANAEGADTAALADSSGDTAALADSSGDTAAVAENSADAADVVSADTASADAADASITVSAGSTIDVSASIPSGSGAS